MLFVEPKSDWNLLRKIRCHVCGWKLTTCGWLHWDPTSRSPRPLGKLSFRTESPCPCLFRSPGFARRALQDRCRGTGQSWWIWLCRVCYWEWQGRALLPPLLHPQRKFIIVTPQLYIYKFFLYFVSCYYKSFLKLIHWLFVRCRNRKWVL